MGKFIDLTSQLFGRLTILQRADGRRRVAWLCSCSCGNETIVTSDSLRSGHTKSCGCLNLEALSARTRLQEPWQVSKNRLIARYKQSSQKKNHLFELTDEECELIFKKNCHYCEAAPFNTINAYLYKNGRIVNKNFMFNVIEATYIYNGIDRTNNKLGYLNKSGQCVPCCKTCNNAKGSMTIEQWEKYLDKIASFQISTKSKNIDLDPLLKSEVSAFNSVVSTYKTSANARKLPFELSYDDCHNLFKQNCTYCGLEPSNSRKSFNKKITYKFNGIDRVDSSLGYLQALNQSVSCCQKCNRAKHNMTLQEWKNWIARIINLKNKIKIC